MAVALNALAAPASEGETCDEDTPPEMACVEVGGWFMINVLDGSGAPTPVLPSDAWDGSPYGRDLRETDLSGPPDVAVSRGVVVIIVVDAAGSPPDAVADRAASGRGPRMLRLLLMGCFVSASP